MDDHTKKLIKDLRDGAQLWPCSVMAKAADALERLAEDNRA